MSFSKSDPRAIKLGHISGICQQISTNHVSKCEKKNKKELYTSFDNLHFPVTKGSNEDQMTIR